MVTAWVICSAIALCVGFSFMVFERRWLAWLAAVSFVSFVIALPVYIHRANVECDAVDGVRVHGKCLVGVREVDVTP